MSSPALTSICQLNTHRLIPSKYSEDGTSLLVQIADDEDHLDGIFNLDTMTDRIAEKNGQFTNINTRELVFGSTISRVINATFLCPSSSGNRFNGPDRGAWYAGFDLETSQVEIAWHKSAEFSEIGWMKEILTYDDYLADFRGEYHDIREDTTYQNCLSPDSYVESQRLAESLRQERSLGIIYPSVRRRNGICLACFKPVLVGNVRKNARYRFTWAESLKPEISFEEAYM